MLVRFSQYVSTNRRKKTQLSSRTKVLTSQCDAKALVFYSSLMAELYKMNHAETFEKSFETLFSKDKDKQKCATQIRYVATLRDPN